ncbi:hypothetical protein [Bradyrhizobium sp. S3.5.5]|uniref:hypothetical protein n=1 Tax=Bradyrhizobium sp. S3.5.5 TaxID=3156430 RepID=UPI0033947E3E
MRTTQLRPARHQLNFVNANKCLTAIPVRSTLHRDALIQSVLDPHVRCIEFLNEVRFGTEAVTVNSIVIRRFDGAYMLDIVGHTAPRDVDEEQTLFNGLKSLGVSVLQLDSFDIRREPRLSSAREIWDHRNVDVPFRDRSSILSALSEYGPQSVNSLEDILRATPDFRPSLYALACADLVEIDIATRPLGPNTRVRARR